MDVQIFDHDGRDNSILCEFARAGQQKAIAAADFSCFRRAQIFEASFSTESTRFGHSRKSAFEERNFGARGDRILPGGPLRGGHVRFLNLLPSHLSEPALRHDSKHHDSQS